jgi:hypothetical protein
MGMMDEMEESIMAGMIKKDSWQWAKESNYAHWR